MSSTVLAPPRLAQPTVRRELTIFMVATFAITWGLAAVAIFFPQVIVAITGAEFDTRNPIYFIAVYAPSIVGIAMIASRDGFAGLADLVRRTVRWRVHPRYYAMILLGLLGVDFLARLLQLAVGEKTTGAGAPLFSVLLSGTPPTPIEFWFLAPLFLLATMVLDAGVVGEEIGWKGYALPRLLGMPGGPLVGSLVFGLIWGFWHAPAFLLSATTQGSSLGISLWWLMLGSTCSAVLMTWLYQRTSGSILVSGILVHLMSNSSGARIWAYSLVMLVPATVAGVSLYRSTRRDSAPAAR